MNRIIYFDICSVIVTASVLISVLSRRVTKGRSNRLFILLLIDTFLTGLLDIYNSLYGSAFEANPYNVSIQFFFNSLYFLFRNLALPLCILYLLSSNGLWHKLRASRYLLHLVMVPYAICAMAILANPHTHDIFYFNKGSLYVRGEKMVVIYTICCIYTLIFTILLIRYRESISKEKLIIFLSFIPFNIVAVAFQQMNINIRVEIFASSLTMLMFAITIQRPEELIDPVVNTQSAHAFMQDMAKAYRVKRPMQLMFIKVINHRALRNNLGLETFTKILKVVGGKLLQMSRILKVYTDIYYIDRGTFVIVADTDNEEIFHDLGRLVYAYLQESFRLDKMEIILEEKICIAKAPSEIVSYAGLINFATTFHNTVPDKKQVVLLSDVMDTKDFKMKNEIDEIIKDSIENNKFEMYYQPIYSVKQDKFVSAEALIRLYDERFGFISPALFIPAAESSGAIHAIGDYVLDSVCRFISSPSFVNSDLEYMEINLSVSQCIEPKLVAKIKSLTEKYRISPTQINLEITETAVDYDPKITDFNILGLRNMGFSFSLDDYGTGYSNIKRVVSLPLDIVKLDKTFVDEMDDPKMWTVIVNTVNMLKRMNKKILVEGVEDERTLIRFIELGCDYIQGFFFSKPLNQKEFIDFVNKSNTEKIYEVV